MLNPRSKAAVLVFVVAALGVASGCSKANLDGSNAAANAYCDCAKSALKLPKPQREVACKAESAAWDKAWKAGPGGDNPKALAIFDYQHGCYKILHDQ